MQKNRVIALLAAAVLCLAGCFEVDQQFTLNPDGSGRVIHKVKQPDVMGQGEAGLKNLLQSQMTEAKGVDAWSDVSVEITGDGSYLFTGTAYFSDLNALELEDADAFRFRWVPQGNGYRLELATSEGSSAGSPPSEAEAMKQLEEMRTEWKQMKPMMQGIFSALRWNASFDLPANVTNAASFEKTGPSTVRFSLAGDRYFEVISEMMADDAFLEKQARSGNLKEMSPENDEALPQMLVEKLFGKDGVYAATASSARPQFDYDSAVADAAASFEGMMAALPVEAPKKIVPPAKGGDFRSLEVISTRFVTNEDLAWQSEGATLTIAGELPGSVITAEEGELRVATASDGTDLLPEEEWDRQVSVSLDSEDATRVKFDVTTMLPPNGAKGFRKVAGVVYYQTATEPDEEIELFSSLAPGSAGSAYGAMLTDYSEGYSEGSEQVGVEINLPREQISELIFVDAKGNPVGADLISTSWSSDSTSLTYSLDGPFPRDGKVTLKVRKGMKTFEIPFEVTNIDLTGRPM